MYEKLSTFEGLLSFSCIRHFFGKLCLSILSCRELSSHWQVVDMAGTLVSISHKWKKLKPVNMCGSVDLQLKQFITTFNEKG